jgi:hypothetical protein
VIEALTVLNRPCEVVLHTDSQYVQKGISEWIHGWKARGWKTAAKEPVKNDDLWKALDLAQQQHAVEWRWVRGHNGHPGNERADVLANRGAATVRAKPLGRLRPFGILAACLNSRLSCHAPDRPRYRNHRPEPTPATASSKSAASSWSTAR